MQLFKFFIIPLYSRFKRLECDDIFSKLEETNLTNCINLSNGLYYNLSLDEYIETVDLDQCLCGLFYEKGGFCDNCLTSNNI